MSSDETHSFPPPDGSNRRGDRLSLHVQDPGTSRNGLVSSISSPAYTDTQPRQYNNPNGSSGMTIPSSSYNPPRQPIKNAVTSAFHQTDSSMSPDLIQLITQSVIKELQAHAVTASPLTQPVQPPLAPAMEQADSASSFQSSPPMDRRAVYTPPSPDRADDQSVDSYPATTMSGTSGLNIHGYKTGRRRDVSPFSRVSNDEAILSDSDAMSTRLEPPRREASNPDVTVLEKHWGQLFDEQGNGTERLTCFLRGIANYLIEEYEPKYSLVVTPDKLQNFYEKNRLEERPELYPWKLVFDDKTSSISRLLRDPSVSVQHHLIQPAPDARPDIPGMTPVGFATWMALLIRAHPDHEFERLTKVLRTMAINHPEERGQRFPAAISRKSLPASGDKATAAKLVELMATHCKVQVDNHRYSTIAPSEPPLSPRRSEAPPAPTVEDAEDESNLLSTHIPASNRTSFASNADSITSRTMPPTDARTGKAQSVTSIEDEGSDVPTPQPSLVERERKPYAVQPGVGKSYDIGSGDEKMTQVDLPGTNGLSRRKSVNNSSKPRMAPPVAVHQQKPGKPQPPVQDGYDLTRSRTVQPVPETYDGVPLQRSRSNSAYAQPHPIRRSRSNSTYVNEGSTRYHPKRSPSLNKSGFEAQQPRATAPDLSNSSTYQPTAPERYEYVTRQSTYDPRMDPRKIVTDRERSRGRDHEPVRVPRPRLASNAGADGRPYFDDTYRQQAYAAANSTGHAGGGPYQYPPSAYRRE
ncbi:hypothetical protein LTS08_007769 [Lithohypha guttulata]|nr:hypothetical protein LTS08_007769 [Lithohypha guttulata]